MWKITLAACLSQLSICLKAKDKTDSYLKAEYEEEHNRQDHVCRVCGCRLARRDCLPLTEQQNELVLDGNTVKYKGTRQTKHQSTLTRY